LLAKAVLPLVLLFILSACGGSAKPVVTAPTTARGPGFGFSVPRGWIVRRTTTSLAARKGPSLVSATVFTLLKPYNPALFGRAAKELDGVAAKLAAQAGTTLAESTTTTVDGRKVRAYRFASHTVQTKIGFVLAGKREYQLLCELRVGAGDPDGACALLFATFSAV
jgi:hypothetical protein